tara:strand:- start:5161 stop:5493 length:333 start_codon:yes stop_codon:yes gene_type:complete
MSHYDTFQEFNQTGLTGLLTYPAHVVPSFTPMLLFAIFMITFLGTFFGQARITGRGGDFFSSFAVASFFMTFIALMFTLVEGLVNTPTIVTCLGILIGSVLLLMTTKSKD